MANRKKKLNACRRSIQSTESKIAAYYRQKKHRKQQQKQLKKQYTTVTWKAHEITVIDTLRTMIGERAEKFFQDHQVALVHIWKYQEKWIRSFSDWQPIKKRKGFKLFKDLVNHLFVAYDLPTFMYRVWNNPTKRVLNWFWVLAKGENIGKAILPFPITKKMAHWYKFAPGNLTPNEALHWAQAMGITGSISVADTFIKTIIRNNLANHHPFWDEALIFFNNHPDLPIKQVSALMRYFHHRKFSREQNKFSLKGRSPAALIRLKDTWELALYIKRMNEIKDTKRWLPSNIKGMIWAGKFHKKSRERFFLQELTSEQDLKHEGRVMRHCVGGYAKRCLHQTSIWSLKKNCLNGEVKHVLTIELNGKRVGQIRGRNNRMPSKEEIILLKQWFKQEKLMSHAYPIE